MKTFSKQSKKLRKFFHSAPLPRAILWILTLVFPIYMTLVANYISFGSRSMLSALITAQTGAFLLGLLLVYGVYFTFVFLFRRFSTAAGITGFLFILLPLIDHFKSIILQDRSFLSLGFDTGTERRQLHRVFRLHFIPMAVYPAFCGDHPLLAVPAYDPPHAAHPQQSALCRCSGAGSPSGGICHQHNGAGML